MEFMRTGLAPQLMRKAQQVYAAMSAEDAVEYEKVTTAALKRYNITDKTYQRRFRTVKRKEGETFWEMATRYTSTTWCRSGCQTVK